MESSFISLKELKSKIHNSELASIKTVLLELVKIINDPLATAKQLKDLIEIDPPLTTRILRLANSAYYGSSRKINDIQEAIIWVGFDSVKHIALSMKALELFIDERINDFYSRGYLWKNSVATALMGKLIYRREFQELGNSAYCLGLLHNVGIIMMDQFLNGTFQEIMDNYKSNEKNLIEVEQDFLKYNHAGLAYELMKEWNFSEMIYLPIKYHHQPLLAPAFIRKEATLLYIVDQICMEMELGFSDISQKNPYTYKASLKLLNIEEASIEGIIETVTEDLVKMQQLGWF